MKEEIKNSESSNTLYKYSWYEEKNVWNKWYRNNSR